MNIFLFSDLKSAKYICSYFKIPIKYIYPYNNVQKFFWFSFIAVHFANKGPVVGFIDNDNESYPIRLNDRSELCIETPESNTYLKQIGSWRCDLVASLLAALKQYTGP